MRMYIKYWLYCSLIIFCTQSFKGKYSPKALMSAVQPEVKTIKASESYEEPLL